MPLSFGLTFVGRVWLRQWCSDHRGVMISSPRNALNLGDFRKERQSRSFSTLIAFSCKSYGCYTCRI